MTSLERRNVIVIKLFIFLKFETIKYTRLLIDFRSHG